MASSQDEEQEAPRRSLVPLLATGVLCLAVGGGAGFVVASRGAPAPESGEAESEVAEPEVPDGEAEAAAFQDRLLSLEPLVINIAGDGYARLLKIQVELVLDSADVREEANGRMPQVRDTVLTLVSSKRLADVTSFEGKALLKDDLRDRVDQILSTGTVESVLFTEFVVQ